MKKIVHLFIVIKILFFAFSCSSTQKDEPISPPEVQTIFENKQKLFFLNNEAGKYITEAQNRFKDGWSKPLERQDFITVKKLYCERPIEQRDLTLKISALFPRIPKGETLSSAKIKREKYLKIARMAARHLFYEMGKEDRVFGWNGYNKTELKVSFPQTNSSNSWTALEGNLVNSYFSKGKFPSKIWEDPSWLISNFGMYIVKNNKEVVFTYQPKDSNMSCPKCSSHYTLKKIINESKRDGQHVYIFDEMTFHDLRFLQKHFTLVLSQNLRYKMFKYRPGFHETYKEGINHIPIVPKKPHKFKLEDQRLGLAIYDRRTLWEKYAINFTSLKEKQIAENRVDFHVSLNLDLFCEYGFSESELKIQ